jgi:hypothetical protein
VAVLAWMEPSVSLSCGARDMNILAELLELRMLEQIMVTCVDMEEYSANRRLHRSTPWKNLGKYPQNAMSFHHCGSISPCRQKAR